MEFKYVEYEGPITVGIIILEIMSHLHDAAVKLVDLSEKYFINVAYSKEPSHNGFSILYSVNQVLCPLSRSYKLQLVDESDNKFLKSFDNHPDNTYNSGSLTT